MSVLHHTPAPPRPRIQRGFTLVELMVTVAIALFLLSGLVTIVQQLRATYFNQQALAQLQDQQRFAMTVLTDIIQAGGYFPDPTAWTPATNLPVVAPYGIGQPFYGIHSAVAPNDTIGVRFRTAIGDGVINCTGGSNAAFGPSAVYTNAFSVNAAQQLICTLSTNGAAAAPVVLVNGVQNLQIYYGVKRDFAIDDYTADTYLPANQMDAGNGLGANGNGDWDNITSVLVILSFNNPFAGQAGQPATVNFVRVVTVMARGGVHT